MMQSNYGMGNVRSNKSHGQLMITLRMVFREY
jgi:hypothetical protein